MTGGGHLACALPRAAVSGERERKKGPTHIHRQARARTHTHAVLVLGGWTRRVDTGFNGSVLNRKVVTGTTRRTQQGPSVAATQCLN